MAARLIAAGLGLILAGAPSLLPGATAASTCPALTEMGDVVVGSLEPGQSRWYHSGGGGVLSIQYRLVSNDADLVLWDLDCGAVLCATQQLVYDVCPSGTDLPLVVQVNHGPLMPMDRAHFVLERDMLPA